MGKNDLVGSNEHIPWVLCIKLHLQMPGFDQLQISPPLNIDLRGDSASKFHPCPCPHGRHSPPPLPPSTAPPCCCCPRYHPAPPSHLPPPCCRCPEVENTYSMDPAP